MEKDLCHIMEDNVSGDILVKKKKKHDKNEEKHEILLSTTSNAIS